ncbi:unnamed protein product [Caenorhabditis angaria]|uniref:PID domain-containing protein n=1 Tax=Caenorhabditis angaria TaxID=860376 RepID=A0A9P1MZ96_9PELO|nr:unnamed protein product [Caenorhabditis angaria]
MPLPLCRCRVLYIGSSVPTITKDGLQGIQQPLRERYPIDESPDTRGIDSWLSVWSNGILLEYIEGEKKSETAFFPINTLHYCAAVRYVNVSGYSVEGGGERFLPLDSPFANIPDSPHPPIFAAILRRTTGVKVLECHGFICTNNKAANALVRCCFHAYADSIYLKMEDKNPGLKAIKEGSMGERSPDSPNSEEIEEDPTNEYEDEARLEKGVKNWSEPARRQQDGEYDSVSISSSMINKTNPKKAASENGANRGALVPFDDFPQHPFHQQPFHPGTLRRSGSDNDLQGPGPGFFPPPPMGHHPMMMPPPHFFPPPPRGYMGPPHPMFMGPPPPHFRGPMFPPPPMGRMMPPPPHFMGGPPPGMYGPGRMPPPPFFFPPPPRGQSPQMDSGPIITGPESVYGTMRRPGAYEEPAYMTTQGAGVPEASYQPANYPQDQYESYYDTFKKRNGTIGKKPTDGGSISSSQPRQNGGGADSSLWDQYEAGIYRKPHINEKAFSGTLRSMAAKDTSNATLNRSEHTEVASQTVEAEISRPDSPPVDYEAFERMKLAGEKRAPPVY